MSRSRQWSSCVHDLLLGDPQSYTPNAGSVGLEVAAGRDGKAVRGGLKGHHTVDHWRPWPQIPGTIIVNIGDPLQIWSDVSVIASADPLEHQDGLCSLFAASLQ